MGDTEKVLDASRWRATIPARALPGEVRHLSRDRVSKQKTPAAVFCMPWTEGEVTAMTAARDAGARVLLESDDNPVFDPRTIPLRAMRLDASPEDFAWAVHRQAQAQRYHEQIARLAHGVIVATEALARVYRPWNRNVYVCPNSVDAAEWPEPEKPDDGVFRVGFAGTTSHLPDLDLIRDALAWVADQNFRRISGGSAEAVLFGFDPVDVSPDEEVAAAREVSDLTWRLAREVVQLPPSQRGPRQVAAEAELEAAKAPLHAAMEARKARWRFPMRKVPWTNEYAAYQRTLASFDVGLAPVIETDFSICRGDSKATEYALSGALPILSDAEPYEAWKDAPVLFAATPPSSSST